MFESSMDMDKKIQKQQEVYKRIQLLGTGSYGKAYLVKEIKTDQLYVIKQILISDMNQQQQQNALRQAKILQALSHPNIIRFKQVYRTSKMRLNIVMQYADEGDLAMRIKQAKKQNKHFQENQILDWFTQICLGIKHIHDRKIIHRDLKAQNIFLTSDKIVKIGDFGVSRVLQKTVMNARTMVGSPYYLSPEIIENKPYSFQTDIWSLGALLYEMCALSPPFTANNLQFLALKIVKGAYGQIPNHYSYDLRSLIKNMLNVDSSKRPNINKILTSKVISKRISGFLTESKRIDQFSHTVIHNKNIFQNNLAKRNDSKMQQKSLLPPPNLINIERDMQNKSQICVSHVNFDLETQNKSRPFTPLIGQHKKGPNNFFNNNKKPSSKNLQQNPSSKNANFNDLMKIKPSALQQKVKLPKVSTNPNLFDRRQSEANIKKTDSEMINPQKDNRQVPNSAFAKKRVPNKDISFKHSPVDEAKRQLKKAENHEPNTNDIVGKWKKPPKTLEKIQSASERVSARKQFNQPSNQNLVFEEQKVEIKIIQKEKFEKKQEDPPKTVKRSQSFKKVVQQTKKKSVGVVKKQVEKPKDKKVSNANKKVPTRKQSVTSTTVPLMEIVSEQVKRKAIQEKQKKKKGNRSSSKNQKKVVQKKISNPSSLQNLSNHIIKKPPVQTKLVKKNSNKGLEKLSQPPRLQFQNQQDQFQSPKKEESKAKNNQEQQISNETIFDEDEYEEMYSHEQFEKYDCDEELKINSNKKIEHDSSQEEQNQSFSSKGSLNLSDSCKPQQGQNENFNKMCDQLQIIKNMIAHANGIIDTLPVFGDEYQNQDLLELSQTLGPQVIRQDDSDMESVHNDKNPSLQEVQEDVRNQDSNKPISQHLINQNNLSVCSNSSQTSKNNQVPNLNILSNQQHLETLKMNLQELFGLENIIFIHKFLSQTVENQGLDFNQKDVQNMIIFQEPSIDPTLLRKYFRLIVTVVIMEQQQNFAGN